MDSMVINFSADGQVEATHNDKFDLGFLGKQSITRATDITWNADTQLWDMHVANEAGQFILVSEGAGFVNYESARKMEVRWLTMARLHDCAPLSIEGRNLLLVLRQRLK
jgi:hypothetical protein